MEGVNVSGSFRMTASVISGVEPSGFATSALVHFVNFEDKCEVVIVSYVSATRYAGAKLRLHATLTSAVGGKWSAARSGHFTL